MQTAYNDTFFVYSSYKRITFQPVLIKLDCKRCHSLHGLVGECHVHINLSLTPTKCPWKTNSIKLEWSKSNFFRCCQFNVKLTCDENEETINWNVLIHHKILGWSLHSNLVAPPHYQPWVVQKADTAVHQAEYVVCYMNTYLLNGYLSGRYMYM